jgi:methionyl-tRNA formyltransferase
LRLSNVSHPPRTFVLFAMNEKGLAVLRAVICALGADVIAAVVTHKDVGVDHDYAREIVDVAESAGICTLARDGPLPPHSFAVAVGWRFMIRNESRLVVLHDSLLPRYRGFAPLVNALINGDPKVGVTALWGVGRYDSGPIIEQVAIDVNYPLAIADAIVAVIPAYQELVIGISRRLLAGKTVSGREQEESVATYSIWRDEHDYLIDWRCDAKYLVRFIDAVGPPYRGACSCIGKRKIRIFRAEVESADYTFATRHPGKVFSIANGCPSVICGSGLVRLLDVSDAVTGKSLLPWRGLRTRFRDGLQ